MTPQKAQQRLLGLTGGIGSGKTAAAQHFASLGVPVIDVDQIAHELTAPGGAAISAIQAEFGETMLTETGALNRVAMRQRVFNDPNSKSRLEAILHPQIHQLSQRRCTDALAAGAPYAVLVVPLLIESGNYRQRVSRIAVVDCHEETQIQRVMSRSGLARDEILRIMAAQVSREQRLAAADDLIDNEGSLEYLQQQVSQLHQKYLQLWPKNPSQTAI